MVFHVLELYQVDYGTFYIYLVKSSILKVWTINQALLLGNREFVFYFSKTMKIILQKVYLWLLIQQ